MCIVDMLHASLGCSWLELRNVVVIWTLKWMTIYVKWQKNKKIEWADCEEALAKAKSHPRRPIAGAETAGEGSCGNTQVLPALCTQTQRSP